MAQEIMVAGAIYEDVPSVRLPDSNGVFHPFTDTSDTTAVAADVAQGKTFHLADGSAATGTAAGATLVTKTVTANGTYDAGDDDADGYSEVTVNVSGGGGGGGGVEPKDVNFIDFDGTIVYSYTKDEFLALTAMPENPTHTGLVSQGWNWSLADAQNHVSNIGTNTIGQMYATESGDTEIDIVLRDGRLSPYLSLAPNGTVTINWGDGTSDTVTGTSTSSVVSTQHTYSSQGRYTIRVHIDSGRFALGASSGWNGILNANSVPTSSTNAVYMSSVMAIRLSSGVTLGKDALHGCSNMKYVTIPNEVSTSNVQYLLASCAALNAVTIPARSRYLGTYAFYYCGFKYVSLPKYWSNARSSFEGCSRLLNIELGVNCSVGMDSFKNCESLARLVINTENSLNDNGFRYCYGLGEIHFKTATPPSVSTNTFTAIPTDCIIYVPAGSLSAYTSASNYPSSSTYTYVEE
jgi:hypothetical protein